MSKNIYKPPDMLFCLGFQKLGGQSLPSVKKLIQKIQRYHADDCLEVLSKINIFLENDGRNRIQLQDRLVRDLLPNSFCQNYFAIPEEKRRQYAVFYEQQILTFMKYLCLHGQTKSTRSVTDIDQIRRMSPLCLIITDFTQEQIVDSVERLTTLEGQRQAARLSLLRSQLFHSYENFTHLICRFYYLFKWMAADSDFADFDIANRFRVQTGLDFATFFSLGFGVVAHFWEISYFETSPDPMKFFVPRDRFFSRTNIQLSQAQQFLQSISANRAQYQTQFKNLVDGAEMRHNAIYSFLPFRRQPLFCISGTDLIPVNLRFLKERFTKGIYWDLFDGLPQKQRDLFRIAFGNLFQEYITNLFRRIYDSESPLSTRLICDVPYGHNQSRSSDIIVIYGNALIVIEVVATMFRMKSVVVEGDIATMTEDVERLVFGKAEQIHKCIESIKQGKLLEYNLNPKEIKRYYPVIVTFEPFPQNRPICNWIRAELQNRALLTSPGIQPLQILCAEDIELLEPIIEQHSLIELLEEKINDEQYRDTGFKTFIHFQPHLRQLLEEVSPFFKNELNEIGAMIENTLFK